MAVLYFFGAFMMFALAAALAKGQAWEIVNGLRHQIGDGPARAPYMVALALIPLALGYGLWAMQNWARMVTLAISIVYCLYLGSQMIGLLAVSMSRPRGAFLVWTLLQAAINAAVVFYLLQSRIARVFHEAW